MDRSELGALLPAEVPGLLRYATAMVRDPHLAEDLVGDTVVRALERAESFRGDSSLSTWLHRILHNLAVDRARGSREVPADQLVAEVTQKWQSDDYTVDAVQVVARTEIREELRDALIRLPYSYRAAVVLHDAEGLTVREIAEVFEVGLPAAKQRLRRGRMMLVSALATGVERRENLKGIPLRCWDARRLVSDYLDNELDLPARTAVESHLQSCPTCPALYTSLVASTAALADSGAERDPNSTIPPLVEARIHQAITHPSRA